MGKSVTFASLRQRNVTEKSMFKFIRSVCCLARGEGGERSGKKTDQTMVLDAHHGSRVRRLQLTTERTSYRNRKTRIPTLSRFTTWLDCFMMNKNNLKGEQEVPPPLEYMVFPCVQRITVFQQRGFFLPITCSAH